MVARTRRGAPRPSEATVRCAARRSWASGARARAATAAARQDRRDGEERQRAWLRGPEPATGGPVGAGWLRKDPEALRCGLATRVEETDPCDVVELERSFRELTRGRDGEHRRVRVPGAPRKREVDGRRVRRAVLAGVREPQEMACLMGDHVLDV